jgi:hypothetical protein
LMIKFAVFVESLYKGCFALNVRVRVLGVGELKLIWN